MRKLFSLLLFCLLCCHSFGQVKIMQQLRAERPQFPEEAISKKTTVEGEIIRSGLFAHLPPIRELGSPSGKMMAGTQDGELYVRKNATGIKQTIAYPDDGWLWDIAGAKWSPDGNYLAVKQIDYREVPRVPVVNWTDRQEEVRMLKYSRVGQPIEKHQVFIVDISNGNKVKVDHGLEAPYVYIHSWSPDGKNIRIFRTDRLMKEMELLLAEAESGSVKILLTEKSDTYILGLPVMPGYETQLGEMKIATFLNDKKQFLWTSERSGYNHLYLYDENGKLIRNLTGKLIDGPVLNPVDVDEKREWVYFTASTDREDPYHQQLYRINFKGESLQKIAEAPEIMEVRLSSSKDHIWVLRSELPDLLQIDEYSAEGEFQETIWKADLAFLKETGYNSEYTKIFAADGTTTMAALILKPADFDPTKKYPVVEYIYGGPHTILIPRNVYSPNLWTAQLLANQGFVVVMIDGRGTPGRGKVFQDFSYGRFGQVEIEDHVAGLRQLFKKRSYMDSTRVGILGHSWGGYFALRAALLEPELYKAVQANAPGVDPADMRVALEPFMGCLPKYCPEAYEKAAITSLIHKLKQPLLIIHGTADDDVPLAEAMKLNEALFKTGNSNYEMVLFPNVDHIVMRYPHWEKLVHEFFNKNL